MASGQGIQERRLPASERKIVHVRDEFAELIRALRHAHAEDVESVFSQSACLVEARDVDFSADIDAVGRDTEYTVLTQATDGKAGADG